MYSLTECTKIIRGTLRYKGFSMIINAMKEIGLFNNDSRTDIISDDITWFELLN